MTIKTLRKILSLYPQDLQVFVKNPGKRSAPIIPEGVYIRRRPKSGILVISSQPGKKKRKKWIQPEIFDSE